MSRRCPTCGSLVERAAPHVDLSTNTLLGPGGAVRLRPRCAEIAAVLAEAWPGYVQRREIEYRVWENKDICLSRLSWELCVLKPLAAEAGLRVVSIQNVGVKLEKIAA